MSQHVVSSFRAFGWLISEFVGTDMMASLSGNLNRRKSGAIYMEEGENTENVYFLNEVIKNAQTDPYLTYTEIIDCLFFNLHSSYGSAIVVGKSMPIHMSNTVNSTKMIVNCSVDSYGAIRVQAKAKFIGENLYFLGNLATVRGAAFGAGEATATLKNCTFKNNKATDKAVVYIYSDSKFSCDKCFFYDNYAKDSSSIFAINNENG